MKKNYLTLIPFILSFACIAAFNVIGSEVAPDGTLIEPFFLIPIAWLFFFIGILCLLFIGAASIYHRIKSNTHS